MEWSPMPGFNLPTKHIHCKNCGLEAFIDKNEKNCPKCGKPVEEVKK